jgi:3-ketosteroid 9alpha-monooxygenase subunit A
MATSAEYRLGEYAFPRGWFALANSGDAGRKPTTLHYFGQDLVLYRGESGRVVLLDAYCPHMGTHLGSGENSATSLSPTHMEGDNIRCPFHAWRFGPDGVCNHIPYHDGPIPPAAKIKSWPVEERYGIIFAWHDPEHRAPDYPVPEFAEWDDPAWVRWEGLEELADLNHPIEIFDNMSDVAHLDHLHGTQVTGYENEYEGHLMHQRETAAVLQEGTVFGGTLTTLSGYVGPGVAFGRFLELDAIQLICVTPIEDGTCRLWQAAMLKAPAGRVDDAARVTREGLSRQLGSGLMRDAEVWRMKRPALHVMQLPGDGPFRQSRVWYSQFYNPRDKADGIVARVAGIHTSKNWPPFTAEAAE